MRVKIAPSILSADYSRLGEDVKALTLAGADYIHIDVMDGNFVPQITIGAQVVKDIRSFSHLPFDVHLMIADPARHIETFAEAGADIITVHREACHDLYRVVQRIKELGKKAGVSLNPATSLFEIEDILPYIDLLLIMTVEPGYGGQGFIEGMTSKIRRARKMIEGYDIELEVDGGINLDNAKIVKEAGAQVLVSGSFVFKNRERMEEVIRSLREI